MKFYSRSYISQGDQVGHSSGGGAINYIPGPIFERKNIQGSDASLKTALFEKKKKEKERRKFLDLN